MSGIPVKELSIEDQKRIYRDFLTEKPVRAKVDSRDNTLENKLKQKETIEKKYGRRMNMAIGALVGSFLVFGIESVLFAAYEDKFAPYRKDPVVVEYLDKKQQVIPIEYEKDKILRDPGYTLEKILGDTAKKDRVLNLQKAINMMQKDIKEKEEKKEVAAYNSFLDKTSPFLFIPVYLTWCAGFIGSFIYLNKNDANKKRELKALGF